MKRLLLIGLLGVSACTMAPQYQRPALPVATQWSVPADTATGQVSWRQLFLDARLQKTIDLALANNRDLRVAALNVQQARASYGIQRAGLLPSLDGSGSGTKSHDNTTGDSQSYSASLGLSWELDLFGRLRALKDAAKEDFFASQANHDAAEISLIAAVADGWINLAADRDSLALAEETYRTRQEAYGIAEGRAKIGVLDDLALSQQKTLVEQAHGDVLALQTAVDQDKAALTLLAGATVPDDLLPQGLDDGVVAASLPVGLPSEVLLTRPDVVAAEHDLKGANANIGAARAAFFPSISLTGSAGSASSDLGHLFDSGNGGWSYGAHISVPIFEGGANTLRLRGAKVSRDIAVARYEHAIQSAFNDVNQALAVRMRIDERLAAQGAATEGARTSLRLSQARYDSGVDSYLTLLDAQRTAFGAEQSLINLRAVRASNLVALYRAIGSDQSLR
ncbi:MAG: efflux transporter outer membrane subunit [Asticcacaulis sp.]|nr:efflux transporter outer membrane subunit [Asticcacaulis sp.]